MTLLAEERDRARKQKEQKLLDAFAQLLSNFVNEGEEPNTKDAQQSQSSDGTKYFDLALDDRTSRPSRDKRRQLKRSQAEGGIIGALQKTIIRYKEGQDVVAKLTAIVEKARSGKLHPGRTQEQKQKRDRRDDNRPSNNENNRKAATKKGGRAGTPKPQTPTTYAEAAKSADSISKPPPDLPVRLVEGYSAGTPCKVDDIVNKKDSP